jgi:hypothetical protein
MFAPKAKSIIMIVTQGGMSQMDTFDPKPELDRYDGRKLTPEILPGINEIKTFFGGRDGSPIMRSPYKFVKHVQCGMDVSQLFPHIADCVDDMCFVRSLTCDSSAAHRASHAAHEASSPAWLVAAARKPNRLPRNSTGAVAAPGLASASRSSQATSRQSVCD